MLGQSVAVAISAGGWLSAALDRNGTVWTWHTDFDHLNPGLRSLWSAPEVAKNLTDVVAIASGLNHTIALKTDGTVWSWGSNKDYIMNYGGQLGRLSNVEAQIVHGVQIAVTPPLSHRVIDP